MSKEALNTAANPAKAPERHTKIIATLGPVRPPYGSCYDMVKAFYLKGANFFRLNFSHGSHEDHKERIEAIRAVERDLDVRIGIIADLQGPKLRIGTFENGKIKLRKGQQIRFDLDKAPGNKERVNFPHPEIIEALEPGADIFMDDGNIGLHVAEKGDDFFVAKVKYGRELSDRKGVNVPQLTMPVDPLTPKDLKDLGFALENGVNWVALSFVQSADDVRAAKAIINDRAGVIAKIEKPSSARENFDAILEESDAIMLARGDLSIEIPLQQVPAVRKEVISKCRIAHKPCIIATQMLETMIKKKRPTAAEVQDVASAAEDGANVMLSGETAVGDHPEEAIHIMSEICIYQENELIQGLAQKAKMEKPVEIEERPSFRTRPKQAVIEPKPHEPS